MRSRAMTQSNPLPVQVSTCSHMKLHMNPLNRKKMQVNGLQGVHLAQSAF